MRIQPKLQQIQTVQSINEEIILNEEIKLYTNIYRRMERNRYIS